MDLNVENHGIAPLGKKKLDIVLGVVKFEEVINGCVGNYIYECMYNSDHCRGSLHVCKLLTKHENGINLIQRFINFFSKKYFLFHFFV